MDAVEQKKAEMKAKIERERVRMNELFQQQLESLARREAALLLTAEIEVQVDALVVKNREAIARHDIEEMKALDAQIAELNSQSMKIYRENFSNGYK